MTTGRDGQRPHYSANGLVLIAGGAAVASGRVVRSIQRRVSRRPIDACRARGSHCHPAIRWPRPAGRRSEQLTSTAATQSTRLKSMYRPPNPSPDRLDVRSALGPCSVVALGRGCSLPAALPARRTTRRRRSGPVLGYVQAPPSPLSRAAPALRPYAAARRHGAVAGGGTVPRSARPSLFIRSGASRPNRGAASPGRGAVGLVQAADDAYQLALDSNVVVEHRRVGIVGRLQADPSRFLKELLSVTAFSSTWATTMRRHEPSAAGGSRRSPRPGCGVDHRSRGLAEHRRHPTGQQVWHGHALRTRPDMPRLGRRRDLADDRKDVRLRAADGASTRPKAQDAERPWA